MEANELRIGNITSYGTIYKINQETDADFKDTVGCMDFMGGIGEFELEKVTPIPLTEDWLDKFSFTKSGLYYVKDQVYIYYATGDHDADFEYQFNYTQKPLFYVHELQNLYFALTGNELIRAGVPNCQSITISTDQMPNQSHSCRTHTK